MTKEDMLSLKEGDLVVMIRDGNSRALFSKGLVYRVSRVVVMDDLRVYVSIPFDGISRLNPTDTATKIALFPEDVDRFDYRSQQMVAMETVYCRPEVRS